jgi:dTDP-4-dehydrorhamnose 3,5-epimerase
LKFTPLPLKGACLVDLEKRGDERGFFARFFCEKEFAEHGLNSRFLQINTSTSSRGGTLRGMHYQLPPSAEAKVVRCIRGALFDVILDLRPRSATFGEWYGARLDAENRTMMYVPEGFAHGFVTLEPDTEVLYLVTAAYSPDRERGVRWDDPRFRVEWPVPPTEISVKDKAWPDYDPAFHGAELLKSLP